MKLITAIEKAVGAGWNNKKSFFYCTLEEDQIDHAIIDPLFWAALGKSEGWDWKEGEIDYWIWGVETKRVNEPRLSEPVYYMHRLIDALVIASSLPDFDMQRTIEVFFEQLN